MPLPRFARSHFIAAGLATAALLVAAIVWTFRRPHGATEPHRPGKELPAMVAGGARINAPMPAGPPWRYGRANARFTIVEYADLECPFCREYFVVLKRWVDEHPDVAWQWQHLPLSMHEPVASAEARWVECVGETDGHAAFWRAVEWVYAHTRGEGRGLPEGLRFPNLTPQAQQCLNSERPDAVIRAQAAEAAGQHIAATPTLRLQDRKSGQTVLLRGPVEGDALLSAIDLLVASRDNPPSTNEVPADSIGGIPR